MGRSTFLVGLVALGSVTLGLADAGDGRSGLDVSGARVGRAVAFDQTPALRTMPPVNPEGPPPENVGERGDGPVDDRRHSRDGALQVEASPSRMPAPLLSFDGPSNADNARIFGFRVNPPDPVGDVGPDHYVAMVNLTFAVYSKEGTPLYGPAAIGTLWQGFAVPDCTDPSGDPVVLYDELANRWILSQFTTRFETNRFFNCVAVSTTPDPLGPYYRYAFASGANFPDYPKYGVMPEALLITTREFAPDGAESVGVYAVNRHKLLGGRPDADIVSFQLSGPSHLVGDGLLPSDLDGRRMPPPGAPSGYLVGSMDDDHPSDGAAFDALNVFHLRASWSTPGASTFELVAHVPIAEYDTIFPCFPTSRDCIPQPGVKDRRAKLDVLSYRQRPLWRLQYRNFGTHESLVTNQSVEARPGTAGVRWWELRDGLNPRLHQEGTWAPDDGVHRWMGSAALDAQGNLAVGYSVSNATDVFPGIRYAGRLAADPPGTLAQGEAVLHAGGGSQLTRNSRWGDYTSMNVDPSDGCTFWYINEYYATTDVVSWRTRIGAFRFPSCT